MQLTEENYKNNNISGHRLAEKYHHDKDNHGHEHESNIIKAKNK